MTRPNLTLLRVLVVTAGITTMSTEMCASRLLAPFFGSSSIVWANVIGLILVYLSVGYWAGGRIADRHPHMRGLSLLTLAAASTIALVPLLAQPVLDATVGAIDARAAGVLIGSFIGTLALFAIPVTLLGMVPPYAVRLAVDDVARSGSIAGSLYALSTIGSIVGTFASTLLLVPMMGTRRTMLATALVLIAASLPGLLGARRLLGAGVAAGVLVAVGLALPPSAVKAAGPAGRVLEERESQYQYIQVLERPGGERVLQLNEGWAVHSTYTPGRWSTGMYYDAYPLAPGLLEDATSDGRRRDGQPLRVLVVGNAAGTVARLYRHYLPAARIDGVELDPAVTKAGRRWFDMQGPNLDVHEADGRPFLANSDRRWDAVIVDAFRQPYIPFHLTTREFFAQARDHLAEDGVVAVNVGVTPGDDEVARAIAATMRAAVGSTAIGTVGSYNRFLIATRRAIGADQIRSTLSASPLARHPNLSPVAGPLLDGMRPARGGQVLTDDHAPIEWMTDRMILHEARGTG